MKIFQMDCSKARKKLFKKQHAEKNIEVINIPGAFEIPLMLKILVDSGKFKGLIALGCVIRRNRPLLRSMQRRNVRNTNHINTTQNPDYVRSFDVQEFKTSSYQIGRRFKNE